MAGKIIPEGYAFVGRGERTRREAATELLKAAEDAGIDPQLIRVTNGGYYVPEEIAPKGTEVPEGYVTEADNRAANTAPEDAEPTDTQPAPEPVEDEDEERRGPNRNANKQAWVNFAKSQGYDESEDLTKEQLIEKYGS